MDFTLAVRNSIGEMLTTPETINPGQKLSINLTSLITSLGGNPAGEYSQGSVAVYYTGTVMPIVGQISVRNPQLRLEHQSEMVENDPGRSDVPAVLNSAWWGLTGNRSAQVMVSNTSDSVAVAEVDLDFQGKRHPLPVPLTFTPYETKTLDIAQLLASIGVDPSGVPAGGITITQAGPHPALIANGKITDAAAGFSSTMYFPAQETERASAVHASGIPIGTPSADSPYAGTGYFIPHVVVRNLLNSPQSVTVTVEYPITSASTEPPPAPPPSTPPGKRLIPRRPVPGDTSHHLEWGAGLDGKTVGSIPHTITIPGHTTQDVTLASILSRLPLPLPFCSIRVQYSGSAGSLIAQISSVDQTRGLAADAMTENEGNGWAGSGANPWHLDARTDSFLFLTDESDRPARIGLSITANGTRYFLTKLKLRPHETRAISLRALRDAQIPDFKKNLIPATATDGSVTWIRIDNVPVTGRLMVIQHHNGMAATYDCCTCPCPDSYDGVELDPQQTGLLPGDSAQFTSNGYYVDCNNNGSWYDDTGMGVYNSSNSSVVQADVQTPGLAHAEANGDADFQVQLTDNVYTSDGSPPCGEYPVTDQSSSPTTVQTPTSLRLVGTTSQGTESICTYGASQQGAGYYRQVQWQVLDQNGQPILMSNLQPSDALANAGGTNTCGFPATGGQTGSGYTDSNGEFPDTYSLCSSACLNGNNCQSTERQTWTVSGHTLSSDIKTVVYTCKGITINGQ